mmetsp:Transcript_820/g.1121  ORF Transcript_820/g.1121 Transcript_820/m.1121 type:complete len:443 (+) Transcript_820:87-1415(+)
MINCTGTERLGSISVSGEDLQEQEQVQEQEEVRRRSRKNSSVSLSWVGKGLAVDSTGSIPVGVLGKIRHSLNELVSGLCRGFIIAYGVGGTINGASALIQRKSLKLVVRNILSNDTRRLALFVSGFCGIFRFVNSIITYTQGKEGAYCAFIAGLLASVATVMDSESRRRSLMLLVLVRATNLYVKKLVRIGRLPYWEYCEHFLFGVANTSIMYGFLLEPSMLQKSYYHWILRMGNVTDEGLEITGRQVLRARVEHGIELPFRSCQPHYHEGPCVRHLTTDWFNGLLRAGKIYLPVHMIPLFIFRLDGLRNKPISTLKHFSRNVANSCMFLTTYVFFVKGNMCFWRNLLQRDEPWMAISGGLMTSFACLFERKSRISELMLYCWTKSFLATWNYFESRHIVRDVKYGEIPLFALSMAIIMSSAREDFKDTYYKLLCFVIGSGQ